MIEIIPTIVPQSFDEIPNISSAYSFSSTIHIDAADGGFAPNTTWIPQEGERLPHIEALRYEAHLMVAEPEPIGIRYAEAGAMRLIAHVEAFNRAADIPHAVAAWKAAGALEVGLAVKLDTSLEALDAYAPLLDCLLVMTIAEIGVQGKPFDTRSIERLNTLKQRFPGLLIQADGGISEVNAAEVARAGAERLCVGSALTNAQDPAAVYKRLSEIVNTI